MPGDCEGADGDEPGDDHRVGTTRLVVVGDRVGERRPGELEALDEDVHRLGELDRERVEAGVGEAREAHEQHPVDEVQRVRGRARPASSGSRSGSSAEAAGSPARGPAAAVRRTGAPRGRRRRSRTGRAAGPRRPPPATTTSQTVSGIVTRTFATVKKRKAFARSSRRNIASMNSYSVNTQRPPIAIRTSPGSERSSTSSEIGSAKGSSTSAPIVVDQKSDAKPVETTCPGPRRARSRSAAAPRSPRGGARCWSRSRR